MAEQQITVSTQDSSVPPAPGNSIFRGPNGIRAGWRVLIFLALLFAITFLLEFPFVLLRILHKGTSSSIGFGVSSLTPLGLCLIEGPLFIIPSIAALIMVHRAP